MKKPLDVVVLEGGQCYILFFESNEYLTYQGHMLCTGHHACQDFPNSSHCALTVSFMSVTVDGTAQSAAVSMFDRTTQHVGPGTFGFQKRRFRIIKCLVRTKHAK